MAFGIVINMSESSEEENPWYDWNKTMNESIDVDSTMVKYSVQIDDVPPAAPRVSHTKQLTDTKQVASFFLERPIPIPKHRSPYSRDLKRIIRHHPFYLHALVYACQIPMISQILHNPPRNLIQIINSTDHKANTPIMLAVKLCKNSSEYLAIVEMLADSGADLHIKDANGWSCVDEAVSQKNRELLSVLFEYLYKEKKNKWERNKEIASSALKELKDFYLEFRWQFKSNLIPLVGKIAPHDVCKLWKIGPYIRLDTTLVGWKNLRAKRRSISLIFKDDIYLVNHSHRTYLNPLEELDSEERCEIINDIMKNDPVQGNVSLLGYNITAMKSWRNKPLSRVYGKWKCNKYKLQFRTHTQVKKRGKEIIEDNQDDYFNGLRGSSPKPIFQIGDSRRPSFVGDSSRPIHRNNVNDTVTQSVKETKAFCYLCEDFPLSLEEFVSVLNVIKNANTALGRLYDFLENEGIHELVPIDSFPVKIEIPIVMGIRAKVVFTNYTEMKKDDKSIFDIPNYQKVSRKVGQKTLSSPRKRILFANIVA
ncbi:unnamed protein product [Blepharisma stoltei]|uniref:Ankyrin repeat domain-containing protein n=1 Tax=Blepharisma stoltei TaxID=1481888 RepID=A0AAU9JK47_9CILI|nr:unnamed protein product [Blepharisma stoltei]